MKEITILKSICHIFTARSANEIEQQTEVISDVICTKYAADLQMYCWLSNCV